MGVSPAVLDLVADFRRWGTTIPLSENDPVRQQNLCAAQLATGSIPFTLSLHAIVPSVCGCVQVESWVCMILLPKPFCNCHARRQADFHDVGSTGLRAKHMSFDMCAISTQMQDVPAPMMKIYNKRWRQIKGLKSATFCLEEVCSQALAVLPQ